MKEIIALVTEKAGISEGQAGTAVETVLGFLKDKLPAGLGSQIEGFLGGDGDKGGSEGGGLMDKLGGMLS